MKDNRLCPRTNGAVKETNVLEVAPLKPVTFRLAFPFGLWYAGCHGICTKSELGRWTLRATGLKGSCLPKGQTPLPLPANYPMASSKFPITLSVQSRPIETVHVVSAVKKQKWHLDKLPFLVRSKQMVNNIKHQQPAKKLIAIRIMHFAKGMEQYRESVPLLEDMRKQIPFIRISNLIGNTMGII